MNAIFGDVFKVPPWPEKAIVWGQTIREKAFFSYPVGPCSPRSHLLRLAARCGLLLRSSCFIGFWRSRDFNHGMAQHPIA